MIPLAAPLAPGEEIRLELIYTIKIPPIPEDSAATRPIPFGYTQNQVNLVDWHLYFPPFRAESGWIMYHPHYYGEHQVYETANFEIQLEMVNPPANLTIAASSAPVATANHHFAYQLSDARNFVFSAGTSYSILEDRVGDVVIYSYAFSPFSNSAAQEALSTTKKSVELYNRLFGPYPHQTLSIVEADFLDGM
ncbi:MAG: M1 family metallopeptidase [Chloroflexi bacterium]|nr:M1 family metallopeptidase [Chloroflexota bacterium]